MRILLTLSSSSLTGPAERMLGDAELLREAGHEVTVAFDTRTAGNLTEVCLARGLATAPELRLSMHSGPIEVAQDLARLRARCHAGLDLIHAHFSHDHHLALMASAGLKTRVVRSLERAGVGTALSFGYTAAFEVPHQGVLDDPRLEKPRAENRVFVLPAAIDPQRFSPGASTKLRAAIGVAADAPLVGIVSRIKKERLHDHLVRAFQATLRAVPTAHLAIIGRGEWQASIERLVNELGLRGQVHCAGYWAGEDLVEAYRGLDVAAWLAPGNDGGCRGVLEAMAVGLPVTAYGMPPMDAQLAEGAGWVVDFGDPSQLAVALAELLSNPERRRVIGTSARARVLARYTKAQRGPALLGLYARALQD